MAPCACVSEGPRRLAYRTAGGKDMARKLDEFSETYGDEGVFEMNLVPWHESLKQKDLGRSALKRSK